MRYWIVKGNPRENDLDEMLEKGVVDLWRTGKPPKKWEEGDRLFFWSSSPRLELVGLGELVGPTGELNEDGATLYQVRYITDPLEGRVNAAELRADTVCADASFLKPAVAQGVLEVPRHQAEQMYRLLAAANRGSLRCWKDIRGAREAATPEHVPIPSSEAAARYGQGFGDAAANREVEQAAVQHVISHYRRGGWTVTSVEREKCGYDLECERRNASEHVEVKGIRGSECTFFLTASELRRAKDDPAFVLLAVTSALVQPALCRLSALELQTQFQLEPIAFRASRLTKR